MYVYFICINNNIAFLIIIHKYRQKFVSMYICVLYMYQCVDNTIFPAFAFYTLFYCFLNGYFIAIILRQKGITTLRIYDNLILHHTGIKTCFEMLKSPEHKK